MKQYNVEFFSSDFTNVSHTNVSLASYDEDYISLVDNEITVVDTEVEVGYYIRIKKGRTEFFGIVKGVTSPSERVKVVSYASFLSLFDTDVLFDTDLQGSSTTLENALKNLINGLFSSSDASMNITGLTIQTTSNTRNWGFNLKSDTEGKHHCIINLYSVLITRALEKYSVVVKAVPDVQAKTVTMTIGTVGGETVNIDADLPNIVEKSIVIKQTNLDVNKLIVYDSNDYVTKRTYYKHPDGTYDTTDSNRITPVVQEIHSVTPDATSGKTFAELADSDAIQLFGGANYSNLIELHMVNDDSLVKPYEMEIGQVVSVTSAGRSYTSILTGKTIEEHTKLTFGLVRIDLTKILKRRQINGY